MWGRVRAILRALKQKKGGTARGRNLCDFSSKIFGTKPEVRPVLLQDPNEAL